MCIGIYRGKTRTGTFFCVITTAVSLPLTATAVWPEPEMALKAYSAQKDVRWLLSHDVWVLRRTNLVKPTLGREYCQISV